VSSGCGKIVPSVKPSHRTKPKIPRKPKAKPTPGVKPKSELENNNILRKAEIQVSQVEGSETAKSAIHPDNIKLKIFDSSGRFVAETSRSANEILSEAYIKKQYRQRFIKIFDDVIDDIWKKKITSQKQLDEEILKAIDKKIGNNKSYSFINGKLIYDMNFSRVSIYIYGSINMVKLIKNSVIIGGGGYILIKEECYEREDALI